MNRVTTNFEFADRVGCDFTTASRLRNGQRLPSRDMLSRIIKAFDLDPAEALTASEDPATFSAYLREHVFTAPEGGEGKGDESPAEP